MEEIRFFKCNMCGAVCDIEEEYQCWDCQHGSMMPITGKLPHILRRVKKLLENIKIYSTELDKHGIVSPFYPKNISEQKEELI